MNPIGIFLPPYEDELWYSVLSRNRRYLGMNVNAFKRTFFGDISATVDLYFINHQSARLIAELGLDISDIVHNHTGYRFFAPFMPEERKALYWKNLGDFSPEKVYKYYDTKNITHNRQLKYCPLCAMEQLDRYGEAYMQVENNLPGIDVCYKHKTYLKTYGTENSRHITQWDSIYLDEKALDLSPVRELPDENEIRLAGLGHELIFNDYSNLNYKDMGDYLKTWMAKKGYSKGVYLDREGFYEDFIRVYPKTFLRKHGYILENAGQFANRFGHFYYNNVEPFAWLLFIAFFTDSFADFVSIGSDHKDISFYDMVYLEKLKKAFVNLINKAPPYRITKIRLFNEAGINREAFESKRDRLEYSEEFLEKAIEDEEKYWKRRARYACRELYAEYPGFSMYELRKRLGTSGNAKRIIKERNLLDYAEEYCRRLGKNFPEQECFFDWET